MTLPIAQVDGILRVIDLAEDRRIREIAKTRQKLRVDFCEKLIKYSNKIVMPPAVLIQHAPKDSPYIPSPHVQDVLREALLDMTQPSLLLGAPPPRNNNRGDNEGGNDANGPREGDDIESLDEEPRNSSGKRVFGTEPPTVSKKAKHGESSGDVSTEQVHTHPVVEQPILATAPNTAPKGRRSYPIKVLREGEPKAKATKLPKGIQAAKRKSTRKER